VERAHSTRRVRFGAASVGLFIERAQVLFDSGRTALARDLLRSVILLAPSNVSAWELLARCHERAHEPEVARLLRVTSSAISACTAQGSDG
jgi:hypothetical protein